MTLSGAAARESINVGQLSIQYLIDGTATGGMGVFELTVPPTRKFRHHTTIHATKNASMSWRACFGTRSMG